jgi:hypothetical protein
VHPNVVFHDSDSNPVSASYIQMNVPNRICHAFQWLSCYAVEVLKRYAPDKNQATTTQYHISDHNFNLNMLSYSRFLEHTTDPLPEHAFRNQIL